MFQKNPAMSISAEFRFVNWRRRILIWIGQIPDFQRFERATLVAFRLMQLANRNNCRGVSVLSGGWKVASTTRLGSSFSSYSRGKNSPPATAVGCNPSLQWSSSSMSVADGGGAGVVVRAEYSRGLMTVAGSARRGGRDL